MTTNNSWGFNQNDHDWKPSGLLIRQLCEVAAQGGNYLLNIGPMADGSIPQPSQEVLSRFSAWMAVNGEAIHGTEAGPFSRRMPWGSVTRSGRTFYLLIDTLPGDGVIEVPLIGPPVRVWCLDEAEIVLSAEAGEEGLVLQLKNFPAGDVMVVAVRYEAEPVTGALPPLPPPPVIPQPADGSVPLSPGDAEIIGNHLALREGDCPILGCWTSLDSYPLWRVDFHQAGTYRVEIVYAIPAHREGSLVHLVVGDKTLPFHASGTGGWEQYTRLTVGVIDLEPAEHMVIQLRAQDIPMGAVMNFRALHFIPASE